MKKFLVLASILLLSGASVNAREVWVNNLRDSFLSNSAVIYAVNIRTFNAKDKNGDGIIDTKTHSSSGMSAPVSAQARP